MQSMQDELDASQAKLEAVKKRQADELARLETKNAAKDAEIAAKVRELNQQIHGRLTTQAPSEQSKEQQSTYSLRR